MPDLPAELTAFMRAYEQATNSHDIDRVAPMVSSDASYWFTDGCHEGLPQITAAISRTFAAIQDEVYEISELDWIVLAPDHAVCRYRFSWAGVVAGEPRAGRGRGTNVIVKNGRRWQIKHEHLSA